MPFMMMMNLNIFWGISYSQRRDCISWFRILVLLAFAFQRQLPSKIFRAGQCVYFVITSGSGIEFGIGRSVYLVQPAVICRGHFGAQLEHVAASDTSERLFCRSVGTTWLPAVTTNHILHNTGYILYILHKLSTHCILLLWNTCYILRILVYCSQVVHTPHIT